MSLSGQRNLPPSNCFAHTQNPLPAYTRSFKRLPEQKHMAAFCFCRVVNQREQQHLGTPAGCSQAPNLQFYCFVHMPRIGRKNGVRKVDLCWLSLLSFLLSAASFNRFMDEASRLLSCSVSVSISCRDGCSYTTPVDDETHAGNVAISRLCLTHLPCHTCRPDCGGALQQFGEDVSEQLERFPAAAWIPDQWKLRQPARIPAAKDPSQAVVRVALTVLTEHRPSLPRR